MKANTTGIFDEKLFEDGSDILFPTLYTKNSRSFMVSETNLYSEP
jgi:hypothetical protein